MNCARKGCDKTAKYYPELVLVPMNDVEKTGAQARAMLEIPLCLGHRREVTVEMLVTPEGWAQICKGFMAAGKAVPDRNRIGLAFIRADKIPKDYRDMKKEMEAEDVKKN